MKIIQEIIHSLGGDHLLIAVIFVSSIIILLLAFYKGWILSPHRGKNETRNSGTDIRRSAFKELEIRELQKSIDRIISTQEKDSDKIERLYEWHDSRDEDGILRWYIPRNFVRDLNELLEIVKVEVRLMEKMMEEIK